MLFTAELANNFQQGNWSMVHLVLSAILATNFQQGNWSMVHLVLSAKLAYVAIAFIGWKVRYNCHHYPCLNLFGRRRRIYSIPTLTLQISMPIFRPGFKCLSRIHFTSNPQTKSVNGAGKNTELLVCQESNSGCLKYSVSRYFQAVFCCDRN